MKRRDFIGLLGGAAAWPVAGDAQQADQTRRIGVLMAYTESDPEAQGFFAAFTQALTRLGWTDGRNLRMEVRWAPGSVERMRAFAKELVDLKPDMILANSTPATAAFQRETKTIPIVFAVASDPVGSGFVASLARPGGNITGFCIAEPSLPAKWIELLGEIAPGLRRAAMMFNPSTAAYVTSYYLPSFEAAAQSLKVAPITARVGSAADIETTINSLGQEPGGGLLVMPEIARKSYLWLRETMSRQFINCRSTSRTVVCSPTEPTSQMCFAARLFMSIACSGAHCHRSFQFKCLRNTF